MNLDLDEDSQLFASALRDFLDAHVDHDRLKLWHQSPGGYDPALHRRLIEFGCVEAVLGDPDAKDARVDASNAAALGIELGRSGLAGPLLGSITAGVVTAATGLDPGRELTRAIAKGKCVALISSADEDELPQLSADGAVQHGSWLVEWGSEAQVFVVIANGCTGLTAFTLSPAAPGVTTAPALTFDNERVARVTLAGVTTAPDASEVDRAALTEALALTRVIRTAAVLGSAERMLDLTLTHIRARKQFGRRLADFQAVKHLCADVATGLTAARLSLLEAAAAHRLRCCAVVEPVATRAVCAAAADATSHCAQLHGGIGFITEHPLHFLYNRCHAGEARLGGRLRQIERVARVLVDAHRPGWEGPLAWASSNEEHAGLDFSLDRESREFLSELRTWLSGIDYSSVVAEGADVDLQEVGEQGIGFVRTLGDAGWLGLGWPEAYGGKGRPGIDRWLFVQELEYRGLPHGGMGAGSIGPAILQMGTEDQRCRFLPGILRGELDFALGYSETEAGTDIAALRTRAVRDGDDYVVNGQKIYTTAAHHATHVWLAVRTGEQAARHRGISVLLVDLSTPGITVRELTTQSDGRTNEVFYDDVRVPVANRLGEQDKGWAAMMLALDHERIMPYSRNRFLFDQLVAWANGQERYRTDPGWHARVRDRIAEVGVRVELARLLALRAVMAAGGEQSATVLASMVKVWLSELRMEIGRVGLEVFGEPGQIAFGAADSVCGGNFERAYRAAPMLKFAGGTNEIQRDLIADRGLELRG